MRIFGKCLRRKVGLEGIGRRLGDRASSLLMPDSWNSPPKELARESVKSWTSRFAYRALRG